MIDKEIKEYEEILTHQPDNFFIRKLLAEAYLNRGLIEKALLQFHKLAQLSPLDGELHHFAGICYYELGILNKAQEEYEKAIKLSPHNDGYNNNLGVIYAEKNLLSNAIICFNNALKLNENNAIALSNLGVVYMQLKMENKAQEAFNKALKIDPNLVTPHYCLGLEYQTKGELHVGEVVKVGEMMQLLKPTSLQLKDYSRVYKTRVEDIEKDTITIGAPIHQGVVVPIHRGAKLIIGIARPDALYGFQTEVIDRKVTPFPVLIVKKLEKVRRIQRRKYVRIETEIPFEVRVKKFPPLVDIPSAAMIDSKSIREKNISAGGALIVVKNPLPRGTILEVKMDVAGYKIKTLAEVVRMRKDPEKDYYEVGINFIDIKDKDRDKITRYIYAREIDLKKKGF